ncbi:MAG: RNA chaperone Hfq [Eubacteriales bacterium]|nr:RNA chaperone Hfq [Eubacteriales bacterium]
MSRLLPNLQDTFVNNIRRERTAVTIYLTNGFQLKGVIKGFDSFTVVIESEGKQQLVYKHAISTIIPVKPVNISLIGTDGDKPEENAENDKL